MRFEQELTLDQIAGLTRMGSPLKVRRVLEKAVESLRTEMRVKSEGPVSVKDS